MNDIRSGTLTITGAVLALIGAAVLSVLLYRIVGFPANIPLAVGSAVALAEIIELLLSGYAAALTARTFIRALIQGLLAAGACWLGVWIVRSLGWLG